MRDVFAPFEQQLSKEAAAELRRILADPNVPSHCGKAARVASSPVMTAAERDERFLRFWGCLIDVVREAAREGMTRGEGI